MQLKKVMIFLRNKSICLPLLGMFLLGSLSSAFAGSLSSSDTLRVYYLGEVVVSAEKGATVLSSAIREFNFERTKKEGILNVASAVDLTLGSYVSVGARNEMIVQLRGIDQRQISVMLDGVPIYVPYDGIFDLGQVPVTAIKKITVTPGNSSLLYGPNSLGGSINILTSVPERRNSRLRLFSGSGNMREYSFQQSLSYKKLGLLLSAGHQGQDYFPLSDDFDSTKNEDGERRENSYSKKTDFLTKLSYRPNAMHHTSLSFSLIDNQKGVPPDVYVSRPRFWKFPTWRKWVLNLSSVNKIKESFLLKTIFFYDKYDNVLDSYDDATYTTQTKKYAFHSTYDDYSSGSNIYLSRDLSKSSELTFGINYKRDVHREQPNRGKPREKYKMDTYTMGAEYELKTEGGFALSSGLNLHMVHPVYAYNQPLRDDIVTLDGRFGAWHRLSPELEIFGSMGRRTRFPVLKELYSGYSGRNIPNPNLKEESSFNLEIGARQTFPSYWRTELVFFDSEVRNMIVSKLAIAPDTFQMDNLGKARLWGLELSTTLTPEKNTAISASYSYLQTKNLSEDRKSDKLEYRPEHKLRLQGEYGFYFGLSLSLTGTYVAKRVWWDDDEYAHKMPDYALLDGKISQSLWRNFVLTFEAKNVLDKDYQTEYGLPMPGRTFYGGVEIEL